jgi:hypothetical protein
MGELIEACAQRPDRSLDYPTVSTSWAGFRNRKLRASRSASRESCAWAAERSSAIPIRSHRTDCFFRPPEVESCQISEQHSPHHSVMEMRNHKIGRAHMYVDAEWRPEGSLIRLLSRE